MFCIARSFFRHEFHKGCIDPWLLEHRTCPFCKMDILKHYGFVVGAQNQIINLNGFILGASAPNESASSDNGQSPTTPPTNTIYQSNQNQNQNHSALTQAHLIHHSSASSPVMANDNNGDFRNGESITRADQILAISPTSQHTQSLNISNFNSNSNSIHTDHLDVEGISSCSFNRCNSSLSSANNTDNTRLSQSSCSNMIQNCHTFSSFIDNTSHPNRNARASNPNNSSSGGRRVSDV